MLKLFHMNYWLIKSEGDCYSIDDMKKDRKVAWTGVRNYQARNFMTRDMKVGDMVLFYHSRSTGSGRAGGTTENPTGVYGVVKVGSKAHVDETQFNKKDDHYDPKATRERAIWHCVDMIYIKTFKNPVTLSEIKIDPKLEGMLVRAVGSRLSIQPVSKKHFDHILTLAK